MKFAIDCKLTTCGRTNVLVNVRFQPLKSILLITTNYFFSTESRNLERSIEKLNCKPLFGTAINVTWNQSFMESRIFRFSNQTNSIVSVKCFVVLKSRSLLSNVEFLWNVLKAPYVFLLHANTTLWDNWQNIPFLLYYTAKVVQIRIDEILHKMLLK